jgi:hypothetical protein
MSATTKIAVGVASGYLLGRTKKLKLAFTVGSMLAGQRIATNPQALLAQGSKLVDENPELQKLQKQIMEKLMDAAKAAAVTTATQRLELLSSSLKDSGSQEEDEDDSDEDESDEEPTDEAEGDEDESGEEEDEAEEDESDEEPTDEADDEEDESGEQ